MKFLFFLFTVFLILFTQNTKAQNNIRLGTPLYKNYSPKDYNGHPQLWKTTQLPNGIMLLASTASALIFDGTNWSIVINSSFPRTFFLDTTTTSNLIYYGGDADFGIIKQDSLGLFKAISFVDSLHENEKDFYTILSIVKQDDYIYFIGLKRIFIYKNNKLISSIKSPTDYRYAFTPDNKIFIRQSGIGLIEIKNGKLSKVAESNIFANEGVYFILPYDKNNYIVGTKTKGLYLFKKDYKNTTNIFTHINTDINNFLAKNKINNGTILSDGRIAISTNTGGIVILNKNLSVHMFFNEDNGLINNNTNNIFQDKNNDIWITTNNGLSILYYGRNINKIITPATKTDFLGVSLNYYKDYLFVGTMSGITRFRFNTNKKISNPGDILTSKTNNTISQVFNISHNKNDFFATTSLGLISFDTTFNIKKINNQELLFTGLFPKSDSSIYISGSLYGLDFYKQKNKTWEKIGHISTDNEVREISEEKKGVLFASTQRNGIYKIIINDYNNPEKHNKIHYDSSKIHSKTENFIYFWNNKTFITGQNKVLKLDTAENKFTDITSKICIPKDSLSKKAFPYQLNTHNLISGNHYFGPNYNRIICDVLVTDTGLIFTDKKFRIIEHTGYFNVIDDKYHKCIWFTGSSGLYNYFYNVKDTLYPYSALIYKVKIAGDSTISINNKNDVIPEINSNLNSIKFRFSSLFFESPEKTTYKYKLEGFDNNWSKPTTETYTKYTNLPFGTFTFKVKAINIYGQESSIATYTFTILPPWYLKWWVIVLEIIILLILIRLIFVLYTRRLKAQNQKLEEIINKRTSELKNKNEELEKLSIVASETDNAVLIMNPKGDFIWINESLTRKYGFTLDEYVKTKAPNIHQSSSNNKITEIFNKCITEKKSVYYENYTATKSGQKIWTQTTLTPILDDKNNIIYVVAIDTDISQLKDAEQKIKKQNDLINYSINYAKKIQYAILPKEKDLNNFFDENFIFYLPKDIISGDFYWFYKYKTKKYIVTADSTGHGVPGAFMSIIGQMLLNEVINLEKTKNLKDILYKLNNKIITTLNQEHGNIDSQNDGMDLSIICFDEQTNELELASANQMIYVFNDNEKIFYEGSVFSIGGIFSNSENVKYSSKKIKLTSDTNVYMFSDGFQDQFDNNNNEKFLIKRFREMILKNYTKDFNSQKNIYKTIFNNWKGNNKQIDDILLIGFKIKIN